MCGKVLVTVKVSQESFLIVDLKDYLYLFDRNVNVRRTEFRGVLLIEGSRDSRELASVLINSPIPDTVMITVMPVLIEGQSMSMETIINSIKPLLHNVSCMSFMVRCRLRDFPIGDEECEVKLRELLRNLGFRVILRGESDCVVYIQSLRDWFGVYVGSRDFVRV